MQDKMEFLGERADALQRAPKNCCQIGELALAHERGALERSVVIAGKNPGFVGNAGRVGAEGNVVSAAFDHAQGLTLFLVDDVAKDAAFLVQEILATRAEFVQYSARDEHGGGDLRRGMAELLSGIRAMVFEEADIFDARIALEIEDALGGQAKEPLDLRVAGIPNMAVVARVLDQNLVRADRVHAVVEAVATAS